MKKITLQPNDSHKSFHGKASVIETKNRYYLVSYSTIVASIVKKSGKAYRHWDDYSPTTMRHINSFCGFFGNDGGGKIWWDTLKCSALPKEIDSIDPSTMNNYKTSDIYNIYGRF